MAARRSPGKVESLIADDVLVVKCTGNLTAGKLPARVAGRLPSSEKAGEWLGRSRDRVQQSVRVLHASLSKQSGVGGEGSRGRCLTAPNAREWNIPPTFVPHIRDLRKIMSRL